MKVAIATDWLLTFRGGERVLESLLELFPEADIYTLFFSAEQDERIKKLVKGHKVFPSRLNKYPLIRNNWRKFLFLYPFAVNQFQLEGYDLVISLSHCVMKGLRVPEGAPHLCYIFTPMRYLWYPELYFSNGCKRFLWKMISWPLRKWDFDTSQRGTRFIAISNEVKARVEKIYHQQADMIYPHADTAFFTPGGEKTDEYLCAGHLVPYKKVGLAVEAFNQLGLPLCIAGDGPQLDMLKQKAKPNIRFEGAVSDQRLRTLYRQAKAFIFPGFEDFGITPLEAVSCGTPVIGYGKGGVSETIISEVGMLFPEQTVDSLCSAVKKFEADSPDFNSAALHDYVAQNFSHERFLNDWKKRLADQDLLT